MKLIITFKDTGDGIEVSLDKEGEETATEAERQHCNGFYTFIGTKMMAADKLIEELRKAEGN